MRKKEFVYLYLSNNYIKGKIKFTQKEIAEKLNISLSTVDNALRPLVKMNSIKVGHMGLEIIDFEKIMVYWATIRNINKDIIYKTFCPYRPLRIESSLPSDVIFTGYSGYRILTGDAPADYGEIYVYSNNPKEIEKRFPKKKGPTNLIVLAYDEHLEMFKQKNCAPLPLIFNR